MVDYRMRLVAFIVFLALMVPIMTTPIVPVIDFYYHVLRYYVLAGKIEGVEAFYQPNWQVLPNLGLDIIGLGVAQLFPPLIGAKLIFALLVGGFYWAGLAAATALSGRLQPAAIAIFALASYSHILSWGFSNFLLGLSLAMLCLAIWVRMENRPVAQVAVAAALGLLIMIVHAFSFMVWGLLLACYELGRLGPERRDYIARLPARWLRLAPVALPAFLFFLASETAGGGEPITTSIASLVGYAEAGQLMERLIQEVWKRAYSFLRVSESGFVGLDIALGVALWGAIAAFLLSGAMRLDRRIVPALIFFAVLVVITPPRFFGVGVVDARIPLVLLCLFALALRPGAAQRGRVVPVFLAGVVVVKVGAMIASYASLAPRYADFVASASALQPGGIMAAWLPLEQEDREGRKFCAPLAPAAGMMRSLGVPTFAIATQQPILLTGELYTARKTREERGGPDALAAGFDYYVVCSSLEGVDYGAPLIEGDGWRVYARER